MVKAMARIQMPERKCTPGRQSGAASARRITDGCRATFGPRIAANSVSASQGRRAIGG